ncbi:MAG: hypothetical protein V4695_09295 [Pseudomonadota bacterium]
MPKADVLPAGTKMPLSALTLALARETKAPVSALSIALALEKLDANTPGGAPSSPLQRSASQATLSDGQLMHLPDDVWREIMSQVGLEGLKAMRRANRETKRLTSESIGKVYVTSAAHLARAVDAFPFLEKMSIGFDGRNGWESLAHLEKLKNLRQLDIAAKNLQDEDFYSISQLKNLESLSLSDCEQITDAGFRMLANLPRLEAISVQDLALVKGTGPAMLAKMAGLRKLDIGHCARFDPATLALLSDLPDLKIFSLDGVLSLEHLAGLSGLTDLKLSGKIALTEVGCKNFADKNSATLTSLKVRQNQPRPYQQWHGISEFKALCTLAFDGVQLSSTDLGEISRLKALRSLTIQGCPMTGDATNQFSQLRKMPQLQMLSIRAPEMDDISAANLQDLQQLRSLNLMGNKKLTGTDRSFLANKKLLTSLDLSMCTALQDDALKNIAANAPNLKELHLTLTKITDTGLLYLYGLSQLRELNLSGCSQISDAGLQAVRNALPQAEISDCNTRF